MKQLVYCANSKNQQQLFGLVFLIMSNPSGQNSIIDLTNESLKDMLLLGNIFDNPNKNLLLNIINQIQIGNKKLYKQFISTVLEKLVQNSHKPQLKQLMYDHITQLMITANSIVINDLNNDVFAQFSHYYTENQGLENYVALWKHMYNGKKDKQDFPNISRTLQKIITPQSVQITGKLSKFFIEFNKNLERAKEKKVEFFQDFEDSSMSQSFADESRIAQIVYMDVMELKAIRQKVESQSLSEQNCTEYLIKMKTFLNLRPNSLSGELLVQFNKQKVWARHFIDHHQEYLKQRIQTNMNVSHQSVNRSANVTNPLIISLSKDQESIQQPPPQRFSKNNIKLAIQPSSQKQTTFGYVSQKKLESEIKNFTINQVPIDESRFTERLSKNQLPVFNNSLSNGADYVNQKVGSQNVLDNGVVSNNNYQRMSFKPAEHLQNAVKPVPISRPSPEQTLPLDVSTIHNISIPLQVRTPSMKINQYQLQQFPKNQNYGYKKAQNSNNQLPKNTQNYGYTIQYPTVSKQSLSASNNPFANSKTNYNPQIYNNTPYDVYKKQQIDLARSPIRKRMTENDLDVDNIDEPLVVKTNYQRTSFEYGKQPNTPLQAQTQYNFYNEKSPILNLASNQKIHSQQLSPRSYAFTESKSHNKKRLSEITSQKKNRKNNAPKQDSLNSPEQYVFKPYSIHFNRNTQNFNNFKRNCFQDKFPIYVSSQLVVKCTITKLKDSKLQVELSFDNLNVQEMKMNVMYRVPKCFKIQKVAKVPRKFKLKHSQIFLFNLIVLEFPLQLCQIDLSYRIDDEDIISGLMVPLPITIRNFVEILATTRGQWTKNFAKLTSQNEKEPYIVEKTFELNKEVVDPSELERVLSRQFINIGASEGYSVEEYGCVCFYREINGLIFLVRISIRVDHIATISIISEHQTTENQRDFMKYYLELLVTLLAKYQI